ncbi:PaaI family thioesterase [Oceanospirillum sanctuarii]|uniref:PaaI family thioesterase n=1 Tax=Oceanospirillum sanctuarii TaxID=1434821 RepID=UPI001C3E3D38|nr:PaaI family thioesterase [Oceanospirillum sanctuarii]
MTQDHFEKLEKMYLSGRCNDLYQPEINVSKGEAEISFQIQESFFHAAGAVHGSVLFKALDDAAYFAANSMEKRFFMVTASFTTYFLRPVNKGRLTAKGQVVNRGKTQLIAESVVYDERGKEVARGNGVFVASTTPLSPDVGYA